MLAETVFENCSMLTVITMVILSAVRVEVGKSHVKVHFQSGHLERDGLEHALKMAGSADPAYKH